MVRILGREAARRTGLYLRAVRKAHNLTQKEVAGCLEVDPVSVGRWEAGIREPSLEHLQRLVEVYGVSLEDILRAGQPEGAGDPRSQLLGLDPVAAQELVKFPRSVQRTFVLEYLPAIRRMGLTLAESEEKYRRDEKQDKTR